MENVRRSVLIVEDDPAQRAMLVELISLWGYRTVAVGSAEEAEALLDQAGALDIAVVDVFLPGESERACMPNPRAFGHGGAGGSYGHADPEARLGFGYVMNRMHMGAWLVDPRAQRLLAAAYACL